MSLDVCLEVLKRMVDKDGNLIPGEPEECRVFEANITHNLSKMADRVGVYGVCWRPEENGVETAADMIPVLAQGLDALKDFSRETLQELEPGNGWGTYDDLVDFVAAYLVACRTWPHATVIAWR